MDGRMKPTKFMNWKTSSWPLCLRLSEVEPVKGCIRLVEDDFLRDAIHSGTLKAKIIGRGYKVKRQDLDEFINNL